MRSFLLAMMCLRMKRFVFSLMVFVLAMLVVFCFCSNMAIASAILRQLSTTDSSVQRESPHSAISHRRLLSQASGPGPYAPIDQTGASTQRDGEGCTKDDIVIYHGATSPLPNGIPTYTVQILNVCTGGCMLGKIHLSCGWFSSARLINPKIFRRVGFNNCLVYDGRGLASGSSISFEYANSFPYQFSVSSASCVGT